MRRWYKATIIGVDELPILVGCGLCKIRKKEVIIRISFLTFSGKRLCKFFTPMAAMFIIPLLRATRIRLCKGAANDIDLDKLLGRKLRVLVEDQIVLSHQSKVICGYAKLEKKDVGTT